MKILNVCISIIAFSTIFFLNWGASQNLHVCGTTNDGTIDRKGTISPVLSLRPIQSQYRFLAR